MDANTLTAIAMLSVLGIGVIGIFTIILITLYPRRIAANALKQIVDALSQLKTISTKELK